VDSPPLPGRVRPLQVLLGVGAVLLVSAGASVASVYGGSPARGLVLALAVVATAASLRAGWSGLRSSAETLAACAAGLAVAGGAVGGPGLSDAALPAFVLAGTFLALHLTAPPTAAWPLAAWGAGQLGVLRALDAVPAGLHTGAVLAVALVGLGIALVARPLVGRVTLLTTAPWWAAGVLQGSASAWTDGGVQRWLSAALVVGAAAGLLVARLRWTLDVLLGPPRAVPVVSGVVVGVALAGAAEAFGVIGLTVAGYAGVLVANTAAALLSGWRRGLGLPLALAAGGGIAVLCTARLFGDQQWTALSVLLLLTAAPTVAVAARRRDDRPVAVPTAVLCLAGAVLLLLPDERLTPGLAAALLTGLFATATVVGSFLEPATRRASAGAAIACAAAAVLLLVADGDRALLAAHLAVQGLLTLAWATRTGWSGPPEEPLPAAWRVAPTLLVLAAWIGATAGDLRALEWYTLPAAVGLLVSRGPRLVRGRSWPAWGPGLLVAAIPSTVAAVLLPDTERAVWVLVGAGVTMILGAWTGVRAPLLIGAGAALAIAVGLSVRALPAPVGAAMAVGAVLLVVGTLRERRPIAGFGTRLADLR
jgi:hypothetical protein